MKTASHNKNTARLAASVCIAMVFGITISAQPNPDYQAYIADKSSSNKVSVSTQAERSDKHAETAVTTESQSNRNLKVISINTLFLDMNGKAGQTANDPHSDLKRKEKLVERYGLEKGTDIFNRKLWIGMTSKMVYESIGEPCDVYVKTDSPGTHVSWAYYLYDICLHFEDDILVSCSDN